MPAKTKNSVHHKRHGHHHRHSKTYKKVYWPYLPVLLSLLVVLSLSLRVQAHTTNVLSYATEMSTTGLLQATNKQRQQNRRDNLQLNEQLTQAAQAKADDMATRNYWSHNTPDGQEPWVFVNNAGYQYDKAGENLAYGFGTSNAAVIGWMNSEAHRANLLDESFTEVGFGYVNAGSYQQRGQQTIVVAMYGRPQVLGTPAEEASVPAETAPVENKAVTQLAAANDGSLTWAPFIVGLLSGASVVGLFLNHGLRLRKFIMKSEKYLVAHPLFDLTLIATALLCINLMRTVGFIH